MGRGRKKKSSVNNLIKSTGFQIVFGFACTAIAVTVSTSHDMRCLKVGDDNESKQGLNVQVPEAGPDQLYYNLNKSLNVAVSSPFPAQFPQINTSVFGHDM